MKSVSVFSIIVCLFIPSCTTSGPSDNIWISGTIIINDSLIAYPTLVGAFTEELTVQSFNNLTGEITSTSGDASSALISFTPLSGGSERTYVFELPSSYESVSLIIAWIDQNENSRYDPLSEKALLPAKDIEGTSCIVTKFRYDTSEQTFIVSYWDGPKEESKSLNQIGRDGFSFDFPFP